MVFGTRLQINHFLFFRLFMLMDKTTKSYIDALINPLLARIQSLQTSNEALRAQVRHLEQMINPQPSYQKPTLSASQQMRESRLSSKGSQIKKPGWNNNPKFQSPSKPTVNEASHQKIKTKPPIPKLMKSPGKPEQQDIKKSDSDKKIHGGTKFSADNNEQKQLQTAKTTPKQVETKRVSTKIENNVTQSQNYTTSIQPFNKFQQLAKLNNELVQDMKQRVDKPTEQNPALNYVEKAGAPKSEYNRSKTASPNSRSFISESDNKKGLEGLKVNMECDLAKIEIK